MKPRILVTGGAGFIGSHIVEELLKKGYPLTVMDNFATGSRRNLRPFLPDIRLVQGDIRRPDAVHTAMKGVRIVIHQAAIRSVPKSVENPFLSNSVNSTGTLTLLHAAKERRVRRFVYASSSSVYGNVRTFPQKETLAVNPMSPYGASKLIGENYCFAYFTNFGLETISLRYFNVYGPRQNPESKYSAVVPAFVDCLQRGKRPVIDGTGKQSRDFTYVKDVARANILAALAPSNAAGQTYNIAGGRSYSVLKVLSTVSKRMHAVCKPLTGPRRKGDPMRTYADTSKARRLLKWKAVVSFDEGIRQTVDWFQNEKGK